MDIITADFPLNCSVQERQSVFVNLAPFNTKVLVNSPVIDGDKTKKRGKGKSLLLRKISLYLKRW
jgi:hypothetical protein